MANTFVTLPVPNGDGFGAWVDTSAIAPLKTISVDGGAFSGTLYLEASNDGQSSAFPADCGPFTGPTFAPQEFVEPCQFMRVRRSGSSATNLGTPSVGVGGSATSVTAYAGMNVPASDGVGTATDLTGGGDTNSFAVVGDLKGAQLFIETSTDGVNFSPTLLFTVGHGAAQTVRGVLNSARVRVRGSIAAVTSLVSVGSGSSSSGGAASGVNAVHAGTAISVTGTGTDPIVNNTGVTSAVAGAGIGVSSATGGVTFSNTGVLSIVAGSGISLSGATGNVTVTATGAFPGYGGAPPAVGASAAGTATTVSRSDHTHTGVASLTAGTAITLGGTASAPVVNNAGVTSAVAGTGIGVSAATGAVTFTNTGVTSIVAGTNITISGATGAVTINASGGGGGVASVTAGTGITLTGTGTNPIVNANLSTGVAGGQSVIGGTAAGNGLTVSSTTNGTKGPITFGSTAGLVYHEDTANLSVGIAAPVFTNAQWQFSRTVNGFANMWVTNQSTGGAVQAGYAIGTAADPSSGDFTRLTLLGTNYTPNGVQSAGMGQLASSQGLILVALGGSGLNLCTNSLALRYNIDVNGEHVWFNSSGAEDMRQSAAGVFTLTGAGAVFTMNPVTPFVGWGASPAAANSSTVMRFALNPPAVAIGAGHVLDAYSWDTVTINITGATASSALSLLHVHAPIFNQTGASTIAVAATMQIDPPNQGGIGTFTMSAGLYINDPNATGNANIIVNDIVYTPTILGASGLGAQSLNIAVPSTNTMSFLSGVALDGSGGNTEGTLNSGVWSLGRTAAVSIGTTGDVLVGSTVGLAAGATHGFPYLPTSTALLTGAPNAFAGVGAPIAFDTNDHLLMIRNIAGSQWEACPTFNSTAAAGAGTVVFTNAPTGIVSLTPKWWTFKTPGGVQTYIPYLQ